MAEVVGVGPRGIATTQELAFEMDPLSVESSEGTGWRRRVVTTDHHIRDCVMTMAMDLAWQCGLGCKVIIRCVAGHCSGVCLLMQF